MSGIALTEEIIANFTGKKIAQLSQLQELDLSGSKIKRVEADAFKSLTNLKSLKLSNNLIKSLNFVQPALLQLRHLDVSENSLSSLEFLEQLPNLEELQCDCNGLAAWQNYVAVYLCPKLKTMNNKSAAKLSLTVEACEETCSDLIESIWREELSKTEFDFTNQFAHVVAVLLQRVHVKKTQVPGVPQQFKEFLLKKMCEAFVRNLANGEYVDDRTTQKSNEVEVENEETDDDKTIEMTENLEDANTSVNNQSICEPLEDYDPVHFIRCHFCDKKAVKNGHHNDDPTDELTNIWWCSMEPNPQNSAETTGIVATCGGDSVCLIDCSTGLVIKRYRQISEQFFCLAWTTLTLENAGVQRKTNILAVSGHNGRLKLLHPEQLVCYAEHGTGRPNKAIDDFYYSCLVFHPKNKSWLFCGSSDTTITLFDIGVPNGVLYSTEIRQLLILVTKPQARVVNMVFHKSTNHLVAGTLNGCYAWAIDENKIKTKGSMKRCEPSFELTLPSEQRFVDGLVMLSDDYVACKFVSDGCIYVFNLKNALKHMNIKLSLLPWCQTSTDFISIGAGSGIVACGDDKGDIWLYNLQPWLTDKSRNESQMFLPSRILSWPDCVLGSRPQERRMTDVLDKPEPLVVNTVSVTSDGNYVVGVTDCNLICIWKKVPE